MKKQIKIQIHPRAFTAFGEDLVTNDLVAVTELIKNSYDAFASTVRISFGLDKDNKQYIRIEDDGCGMTFDTIENAWATLATPYKKKHPFITREKNGVLQTRVVSGNKGLGRFSAARLGTILEMNTKHKEGPYLKAIFDWDSLLNAESISDCSMNVSELDDFNFINNSQTGTCITIKNVKSEWDKNKIMALTSDLSRLINPFEEISDFSIFVSSLLLTDTVKVRPHEFIEKPIYKIYGEVDNQGCILWKYIFNSGDKERKSSGKLLWCEGDKNGLTEFFSGEFTFEIRTWDLDTESIADVSERFNIGKRDVRTNIGVYKGLSIYRDKVLVLPKSESSRDWLGLDAKRISQIGRKISTSQIVGIVNITSEKNPEIKDTTDREKLVDNIEYAQFIRAIYNIVGVLESERLKDRTPAKKSNISDLMSPLSSKNLLLEATESVKDGKSATDILNIIKNYDIENEKSLDMLNNRLIYYAQSASLGSVAMVIMHEFLTGMTIIKRYLNQSKKYFEYFDNRTKEYLDDAELSHQRISEVTGSFAPLHRKDLRKISTSTNLKSAVEKSIRLISGKKVSKNVEFKYEIPDSINVKISESELQTIFVNLFDNACYWIQQAMKNEKIIVIKVDKVAEESRISVTVSDNGLGIEEADAEKIFMPGVTSKSQGIGMGLVIVSELLNYYGNKIGVQIPGDLSGASFIFDLHEA